jgi:hypothetical protein
MSINGKNLTKRFRASLVAALINALFGLLIDERAAVKESI